MPIRLSEIARLSVSGEVFSTAAGHGFLAADRTGARRMAYLVLDDPAFTTYRCRAPLDEIRQPILSIR